MDRIAIYLGESRPVFGAIDLKRHFQGAKMLGLRVVTLRRETVAPDRPVLRELARRMEEGEFDGLLTIMNRETAASLSLVPGQAVLAALSVGEVR